MPHGHGAQGSGLRAGAQPLPRGDPKGGPREVRGWVAAPSRDLWGRRSGRRSPQQSPHSKGTQHGDKDAAVAPVVAVPVDP